MRLSGVMETSRDVVAMEAAKRLQDEMERRYGGQRDGDYVSYWYGKQEELASLLDASDIPTEDLELVGNGRATDADNVPYEVDATEELIFRDCPSEWGYALGSWYEVLTDFLHRKLGEISVPAHYVRAIANVVTEQFTPRERWWLGSELINAWWLRRPFEGLREYFNQVTDIAVATMLAVLDATRKQAGQPEIYGAPRGAEQHEQ